MIGAAGSDDRVDLIGRGDVADRDGRDTCTSLRTISENGVWNMRP